MLFFVKKSFFRKIAKATIEQAKIGYTKKPPLESIETINGSLVIYDNLVL